MKIVMVFTSHDQLAISGGKQAFGWKRVQPPTSFSETPAST